MKDKDIKIGDLVRCTTVDGKPVGLVVERFSPKTTMPANTIFYVLIPRYEDPFPIRTSQVEVINESR